MISIRSERQRVASGVNELDVLLDGLFIGDNVVWYDEAGSLASLFCLNFIQASQALNKPLIYVTFDRSPKNLLDKLGPLGESPSLTILDCFTQGKGAGSPIFLQFYQEKEAKWPCHIIQVAEPRNIDHFMDVLYGVHAPMEGYVRFIFESITGMEELWGSEEHVINFYSHSCPRLYELNTIAYWIIEKSAHSARFRAQINQIAQVVIELTSKSGSASLNILKAEKRDLQIIHEPHDYHTKDLAISFGTEQHTKGQLIAQRYEKVARLGIGTFGETWKVRDIEQEGGSPFYVVKIAHNSKHNALFRSEAEICQRLEGHPSAVKIIDVVKDHGRVVLVQEFILGWTLQEFMEFSPKEHEKENLVLQLVDIVAYAHEHDIVHRDIKPEHIIVQLDGTVRLLD
ncbi:MAG: protein kinase, partial [Deltaproteobacteria bacterium]